ncbi:MAG: hypothetical protein ACRCXT_13120 [Paraclostridium sp.]
MARADIISILYSKEKSPLEFNFDMLMAPPMYTYLTMYDIQELNRIATSARYASKIEIKYKLIDDIMKARGFRKLHCGTNRVVYKHLENETFVAKIAIDKVGITDNPREFINQNYLKPFVTKVFECSPCGTVAFVERVQAITSRQEFMSVADDVFHLITNYIIGKYVLEDIGTKFFMNYGLRNGYGPVLLDFPYVFELDGYKMHCNKVDQITGVKCTGIIDYDDGFNALQCNMCGKRYFAHELESSIKNKTILMKEEGDVPMKISLKRGNKVIELADTTTESEIISIERVPRSMRVGKNSRQHRQGIYLVRGGKTIDLYEKDDFKNNYYNKKNYQKSGNNHDKNSNRYGKNNSDKNNRYDKNRDDHRSNKPKDEKKYNTGSQNRKNAQPSNKFDKFYKNNDSIKKDQTAKDPIVENIVINQEAEKLEEVKDILASNPVENMESKVDIVQQNDENSIYKTLGLSESDFDEPDCIDKENEELYESDDYLLDQY